jgi:hypothetical protein
MADDTSRPTSEHSQEGRGPGPGTGRGPGRGPRDNREPGGFRIRLSDNEMQAAQALQEALGLRSTVAVLGFCLRTLAQQLEDGQLEAIVAQQRAQAGSRGPAGGPGRGDDRRPGRDGPRGGGAPQASRANPFARPSRPAAAPAAADEQAASGPEAEAESAMPSEPSGVEEAPESDAVVAVAVEEITTAASSEAPEAPAEA